MYEVACPCQITRKAYGSQVKKETVKRKRNNDKIIKDNNGKDKTIVKENNSEVKGYLQVVATVAHIFL